MLDVLIFALHPSVCPLPSSLVMAVGGPSRSL